MLVRTKKRHTEESVRFIGPPAAIKRLRELARKTGAVEASDTIPASEVTPELDSNPGGLYLKGIRYRDDITQEQLSRLTGIHRRHISEMENGKRPIGKESARKLAAALHCDYRRFL
ncbi:MAG: transcriptional regulator [Deltaproteobacteria bacterium CG23_combo_of_CG06-09_8_20_14_all_60_8]|nr:MAG: transcriptional regulator [Desulfobacterales bacterium CG2_30_60_27]PIP42850.1 MAG: transcriptional regulator [Deltaproteobacteria bacterium CG23_combo_of_CG06-09_8_20_14_all_60_8]